MKFMIRQRIFSIGDSFAVRDEYGNDRYVVRGRVFSLGDKLTITDISGAEVAYIEQQIFRVFPEYDIYLRGSFAAKIKKQFTFFSQRFDITGTLGSYTVDGDVLGLDFKVCRDGIPVAYVSKKFFSWSDTYGVDIPAGEDEALILAVVIVIDEVVHDNRRNNQ